MAVKTYSFCYGLSDRYTTVPLFIRTTARTYRIAVRRAEVELKRIVRTERAARWEWVGDSLSGPWKARYVPYHHVRGRLYPGHKEGSWKRSRQRIKISRASEPLIRAMGAEEQGAREAFASFITPLIEQVIADTPNPVTILEELFSQPLYDPKDEGLPSIPLEVVQRMDRANWPERHP